MKANLLLVMALFAGGCVGTLEDPGDGTTDGMADDGDDGMTSGDAAATYKTAVHPIMAKCGASTCHGYGGASSAIGKFYETDATATYGHLETATTITSDWTASAPILTRIAQGHYATYTPDEITKITGWLAKEATERAGEPPPPVTDPQAPLKVWSGCMDLTDFQSANMAIAWGNLAGSNPNKSCIGCHGGGLNGFIATTNETQFFTGITTQMDLLVRYFTIDQSGNVIVNTGPFIRVGAADSTVINHPHFDPLNNAGMTALNSFYTLTMQRKTAGTCLPPRITP